MELKPAMSIGLRRPLCLSAVFAALLYCATIAHCQMNTGEVAGAVADPTGARIPSVTVVALNVETQAKFVSTTDEIGEYLLSQLPPGDYTLTANAQGFKQSIEEHFALHVNDRLHQDFALQVGDVAEAVIVQIGPSNLQTESVEIKDVVQNQQILDLPLKSREFLQLTLLSEGVVNPPGGTRGDALQQTGSLINVLGQRTGHNLFLVDGVSITDEYFNNVVPEPIARRNPGVHDRQDQLRRGVRRKVRRRRQRHHPVGHESTARQSIRIRSQQHFRCTQLFRRREPAGAAASAESVRRGVGRPGGKGQHLFLPQLRRPARSRHGRRFV